MQLMKGFPFAKDHREFYGGMLFFIVAFAYFLFLQFHPTFPDPDSFYHARQALILSESGQVGNFRALPFTVLEHAFSDQHFLYHVALVPFVAWLPEPLLGLKLATVFFASLLALVLVSFLKSSGLRFGAAVALVSVALLTNPFAFRMGLAKAPALSLIWFFIGMMLVMRKHTHALFVWSFFYVWLYGGFPLLPIGAIIYIFFDVVMTGRGWRSMVLRLREQRWVQVLGALFGGTLAGLWLHPEFPNNLLYWWNQTIEIGLKNYQQVIGVGGEWYPYGFPDLINNTILLSALFLVSVYALIATVRKQDAKTWTFGVLSVLAFALTLKSRRYVELYIPFLAVYLGLVFRPWIAQWSFAKIRGAILQQLRHPSVLVFFLVIYGLVMFPAIGLRDAWIVRQQLSSGLSWTTYERSANYLKTHVPANEIIVHSDWDEFPILFYFDDTHRYIAGLDPTFFYMEDHDRYWAWVKLTRGETTSDLAAVLDRTFQSRVIFVTQDHSALLKNLDADPTMRKVYEDDEARIYQAISHD